MKHNHNSILVDMEYTDNKTRVCKYGSVIIDTVEHLVVDKFIKCDSSLNSRSWNTTQHKTICIKCFNGFTLNELYTKEQLEIFKKGVLF